MRCLIIGKLSILASLFVGGMPVEGQGRRSGVVTLCILTHSLVLASGAFGFLKSLKNGAMRYLSGDYTPEYSPSDFTGIFGAKRRQIKSEMGDDERLSAGTFAIDWTSPGDEDSSVVGDAAEISGYADEEDFMKEVGNMIFGGTVKYRLVYYDRCTYDPTQFCVDRSSTLAWSSIIDQQPPAEWYDNLSDYEVWEFTEDIREYLHYYFVFRKELQYCISKSEEWAGLLEENTKKRVQQMNAKQKELFDTIVYNGPQGSTINYARFNETKWCTFMAKTRKAIAEDPSLGSLTGLVNLFKTFQDRCPSQLYLVAVLYLVDGIEAPCHVNLASVDHVAHHSMQAFKEGTYCKINSEEIQHYRYFFRHLCKTIHLDYEIDINHEINKVVHHEKQKPVPTVVGKKKTTPLIDGVYTDARQIFDIQKRCAKAFWYDNAAREILKC